MNYNFFSTFVNIISIYYFAPYIFNTLFMLIEIKLGEFFYAISYLTLIYILRMLPQKLKLILPMWFLKIYWKALNLNKRKFIYQLLIYVTLKMGSVVLWKKSNWEEIEEEGKKSKATTKITKTEHVKFWLKKLTLAFDSSKLKLNYYYYNIIYCVVLLLFSLLFSSL